MTAEIDRLQLPITEDGATARWLQKMQQASTLEPRLRDSAIHRICEGLAERAVQYAYRISEQELRREQPTIALVTDIYKRVNLRVKHEQLPVTREYARDIYWTVIPELLRANRISGTFLNSEGHNSKEQIIAVAMALMRAEQHKTPVIVVSQMCAQYDSGTSHDSDSFSRGLLPEIHPEKVKKVTEPLRIIGETLRSHEIPVSFVTFQLSPDPKNMLAMVPATVWSYIEQGKVAEMLQTLGTHRQIVDNLIKIGLAVDDESDSYQHSTRSYDERSHDESVMDRTFRFCDVYVDAYREWVRWTGRKDIPIPETWQSLEVSDVRGFIRAMESEWLYQYIMGRCETSYKERYGKPYPKDVFEQMQAIISQPSWGTLDDTAKFYGREVSQRAASRADRWKRTIEKQEEIRKLLADPTFHPEITDNHERQEKAKELIEWVEQIANIGIGSRAIFNTALYLSFGEEFARYEQNGNIAIMWPMEEDVDRFALAAMNTRYHYIIEGKGDKEEGDVIPCVYPCKELRQPLK